MKFTSYPIIVSLFFLMVGSQIKAQRTPSGIAIEKKVDSLLALMTLEEKVGQLTLYNGTWEFTGPPSGGDDQRKYQNIKAGKVGAMLNVLSVEATRAAQKLAIENSRLGIPLMFGYDVIHGYKTMMPIPLAQSASWDPEVARIAARYAAREASASGVNWTFAPMIDITRDARWGRMMESPGEDPYLASRMAEAWVKGFQGDDLSDPETIAACAKHFAAYGFAEAGRDYNTVDVSMQTLYNVALPPFKAAVDAGVATVMNAFNEIAGVPATGSIWLQREVLKGTWGFEGFVVSDWASVGEMITHGFAADTLEAAVKGITAGSDMDMESFVYETALAGAVEENQVDVALIDDAVRRILRVKYQLGLFEDPYRYCDPQREKNDILTRENLSVAREIARKTMVLLKNENGLLPIGKSVKSIAVIGSLAESRDVPLGSWRAQAVANSAVSLLEGIRSVAGEDVEVRFATGYKLTRGNRSFLYELDIVQGDHSGFDEAVALAERSDVVVMSMGEDCWQTGEGRSQADVSLKGDQLALLREIAKVNKNIVVTLMNGRALAIPEVVALAPSILEVWHAGSEAGHAIADVLFGKYNPSGKLPVSFPKYTGQLPIYYNHKNTGRPVTNAHDAGMVFWSHYTDAPNEPLFPFGYGLSYTTFSYSPLMLSATAMTRDGSITVKCRLKNTGELAGEEVVQMYIRDHVGSVTRPVRELKAFEKVYLEPGEEKEVTFTISNETLSYFRHDLTFGSEPGKFTVMIGGDSKNVQSADFELE